MFQIEQTNVGTSVRVDGKFEILALSHEQEVRRNFSMETPVLVTTKGQFLLRLHEVKGNLSELHIYN